MLLFSYAVDFAYICVGFAGAVYAGLHGEGEAWLETVMVIVAWWWL